MKQLKKTEWRRIYPLKKILLVCVWALMALAGCVGLMSRPEDIPSLVTCIIVLGSTVLTFPRFIRYIMTSYQSLPALNKRLTKREQEELIEGEKFMILSELKTESLIWKDLAESEHWIRIHGRYVSKELAVLGGPKVTFNIMNRDTTPMIFFYATGDVVEIDLGVQISVQRIRELNAYLWAHYKIFPEHVFGKKREKVCSTFREIYMDYLKEREGMKESEVIAELTKNAGELRRKCIDSLPVYLKDIDEKARWNKETREKIKQWKKQGGK